MTALRLVLPVLLVLLAQGHAAASQPVRVVATVGMLADSAAALAGPCAEVAALIGPGADPHLYEATPADIRRLREADLILYLGLGLEGRLAGVLARLADRQRVLGLGAALPADRLMTDADGVTDPHVWMDPALWAEGLPALAAALAEAAPDCAEGIAERHAAHAAELAALDGWAAAALATLPEDRRVLVTAHDAFGYFGRAYGLRVEAIQGLSTAAEPSVADIRATARLVAELGVPAVFVETTINPRTVEAMVAAARDLGHEVKIGAELYADSLGPPGTPEATLIGMLRWNVLAIAEALGGAPGPLPPALAAWADRAGLAEGG